MSAEPGLKKFDPDNHRGACYDAFIDYCEAYAYEYEAIAKDPASTLNAEEKEEWIQINKRKLFLGRFASRNLQKDFEEVVPEAERSTITFTDMITRIKERYRPLRNTTLANFDFHKLKQKEDESFEIFINRMKKEANGCSFQCNPDCNIKDIMIRDQIIIGTTNDDIRKNALNNQWGLNDLIMNGRKMEAATTGAKKLTAEAGTTEKAEQIVNRVHRPGKYSKKKSQRDSLFKKETEHEQVRKCYNCSSKHCKGGKRCPAHSEQCFQCGKRGHFKGSKACRASRKSRDTRRVVDDNQSSTEASHTSTNTETDSQDEMEQATKRLTVTNKGLTSEVTGRHIYGARRVGIRRTKPKRNPSKKRYEIVVGIRQRPIKAFADTGADISIMSKKTADHLNIQPVKTAVKIRPYGSRTIKCVGQYISPVRFGETVTNVQFYVVKKDLETLLSGPACEELGIIKINDEPDIRNVAAPNNRIAKIVNQFPNVFNGIGTLKDYTVKLHIDENVNSLRKRQPENQ